MEELFSFPVRDALYVHAIESGEYLFRYDDALNRLYFLVEGRSKSYVVHANGSVSLLAFSGPGTIMGDMELVGSITDDYLVQAVAPCIAIALDLRNCREQVLNDAKFLRLSCAEEGGENKAERDYYAVKINFKAENGEAVRRVDAEISEHGEAYRRVAQHG